MKQLTDQATAEGPVVTEEWTDHPLLSDVLAVDLDQHPQLILDPLLGLLVEKDTGQ